MSGGCQRGAMFDLAGARSGLAGGRIAACQAIPAPLHARVKYEQTIGDLRKAAATALGVSPDLLQLFWKGRELTGSTDGQTLLEANLHTGFSLMGYDLSEAPDYWPAVVKTDDGLVFETVAA